MRTNMRSFRAPALVLSSLAAAGCASIISGRHADVIIESSPPDAAVVVHDKHGQMVAQTTTPGVVSLKRGDGPFRRAKYTATIAKPGFQTAQVPINSSVNWWTAGNVVVGGVPGLVIDPYTGAMWKPNPSEISLNLNPTMQPPEVVTTSALGIDPAEPNLIQ
jgi:hypothetical protein